MFGINIPELVNGFNVENSPTVGVNQQTGLSDASKFGILSGVTSFASGLASNYINSKTAGMMANTYASQARIVLAQAQQQSKYINEESAQKVWNSYDNLHQMIGTQSATRGASGFAASAGDQNIIQDSISRNSQYTSGINRSAFLQAFEVNKKANMEATRLNYAAKSYELTQKQYGGLQGLVTALSNSSLNALGAYYKMKPTETKKTGNVDVYGSFA